MSAFNFYLQSGKQKSCKVQIHVNRVGGRRQLCCLLSKIALAKREV
jgi:hypothetical protein